MSDKTIGEVSPTLDLGALSGPAKSREAREKLAIEGFEIFGMLGKGGMGVVYHARQRTPSRPVALKMILAGAGATPEQIRRFENEAEALGKLQHENIVRVYSAGEADGYPFIALEYIDGPTLSAHWEDRPQAPREVAAMMRTLALAIEHAHERDIVHRDLKPGNVLLQQCQRPMARVDKDDTLPIESAPVPKISDFGLAKQLDEQFQVSLSGQLIGTPGYMAPEQAVGAKGTIGPAVDIYALGAILYCGLTGRAPFRGANDLETLDQVRFQEPVPPRQLVRKVPKDLETICLKCLRKNRAERYASALDLADDLRRFLEYRPIQARPAGLVDQCRQWCARNRKEARWIGAAAVLLLICAIGGPMLAAWAIRGQRLAERNEARANKETERAREAEALKERQRYAAEINLAYRDWQKGRNADVLRRLSQLDPKLRGFEWDYLKGLCHRELATLGISKVPVSLALFSRDGRWLVSAGAETMIRVSSLATHEQAFGLPANQLRVSGLAFSPDGNYLASVGWDGSVKVWDFMAGREVRSWNAHALRINGVDYSPDGRWLATASHDGTVGIWDWRTGTRVRVLRGPAAAGWCVRFAPDGHRLGAGYSNGAVLLWEPDNGKEACVLPGHVGGVECLDFSPDGRTLSTGGEDHAVRLWDAQTGQCLVTFQNHSGAVWSVAFSPDGSRLASTSEDGTARIWDVRTRVQLLLLGHESYVYMGTWSPDGRRIATATFGTPPGQESRVGCVKLWDAASTNEVFSIRQHTDEVRALAYSPDRRWLASAGKDCTVRLWGPSTGESIRILEKQRAAIESVAFDGQSRLLAIGCADGAASIWDPDSGRHRADLAGHSGSVTTIALSSTGEFAASGSEDGTVRLWDTSSGRAIATIASQTGKVFAVAISPDDQLLVWGGESNAIRVWDIAQQRLITTFTSHNAHVRCLAFGRDSVHLAAAGFGSRVEIWNVLTNQELCCLAGHKDTIEGVTFDKRGERLASTSRDGTVRLWDAVAGVEILALGDEADRERECLYRAIALSPDGDQLACAGEDWSIRLWDAGGDYKREQVRQETYGLLSFQFHRGVRESEVRDRLLADNTIREEVRHQALSAAESFAKSLVERQARRLVRSLFAEALLRPEVILKIRTNPELAPAVRQTALALAESEPENVEALRAASWFVVRQPDSDPDQVKRALLLAQAAYRLVPESGRVGCALGAAYYRAGNFNQALQKLTEAEQLTAANQDSAWASTLAFFAMAQQRLGQGDQARATMSRLRQAITRPECAKDPANSALWREAESVTAGGASRPHP